MSKGRGNKYILDIMSMDDYRELVGNRLFNGSRVNENGCWVWQKSLKTKYGKTGIFGKTVSVHRAMFFALGIEIPEGMHVDHECRNKKCCNPFHLRIVTPRVNALENNDGITAINSRKTHCNRGHEYTRDNILKDRNGRKCRECARVWNRIQRRRKKGMPLNRDMKSFIAIFDKKGVE